MYCCENYCYNFYTPLRLRHFTSKTILTIVGVVVVVVVVAAAAAVVVVVVVVAVVVTITSFREFYYRYLQTYRRVFVPTTKMYKVAQDLQSLVPPSHTGNALTINQYWIISSISLGNAFFQLI